MTRFVFFIETRVVGRTFLLTTELATKGIKRRGQVTDPSRK